MFAPARHCLVLALSLGAFSVVACGGPVPAKTGGTDAVAGNGSEGASGTGTSSAQSTAARGPRKPSCEGGTCSPCGEGICPNGFYCEISSKGRTPACAWLPACGDKQTCACLDKVAVGCTCEERGGAPFLTCG